ncbi:beta-ketoacyl synthase N-terminal-like domain-containing protein [Frankia sp. CcWB3]
MSVVVTGLGQVGALAPDVGAFDDALRDGRVALAACPAPAPPDIGPAFAARLDGFDLDRVLAAMKDVPDALRRLAVRTAGRAPLPVRAATATAVQAWVGAGLAETGPPAERVGVVVAGSNLTESYSEAAHTGRVPARYALRHYDTDHVGTLSRVLGLRGEGCAAGGASASGNVGLITAARMLADGSLDACLVVGALTELSSAQQQGFLLIGAMASASPEQGERPAAPFDRRHREFHAGQAAACVMLETATSAAARGAAAVVRLAGHAAVLDGNHLADPSAEGEARAIRLALDRAGIAPSGVDYVSTHGTGAPTGDRVEAAALRAVFGDGPWPRVNATKGLTGHCLSSAGVVEAVATALQVRGGLCAPQPEPGRCRGPGVPVHGRAGGAGRARVRPVQRLRVRWSEHRGRVRPPRRVTAQFWAERQARTA